MAAMGATEVAVLATTPASRGTLGAGVGASPEAGVDGRPAGSSEGAIAITDEDDEEDADPLVTPIADTGATTFAI